MTETQSTHYCVVSALATRAQDADHDFTRQTVWTGSLPAMEPEAAFRFFNRVVDADASRLDALGYHLPSLSVGDLLTIGSDTYKVENVGFTKLDPPAPCGWCRRCAIHDDPGGCLEVEAWEREALAA